jgi:Alkylmercury lyase
VVSIVLCAVSMSDFRQKLCDEQHFFSSATAALGWHAERPEAIVVPVRSGFALVRLLTDRLFGGDAAVA